MGNPREYHINKVKLFQIALFKPFPAHVLPDEVDGRGAVKQDCAQRANRRTKGNCHGLAFRRRGGKPHRINRHNGERNAYVRDCANIRRNRAAGCNQRDVHDLNRRAKINTCLNIAHNRTDDQTGDQRTAQGVVAKDRAAKAGPGCQTSEQSK